VNYMQALAEDIKRELAPDLLPEEFSESSYCCTPCWRRLSARASNRRTSTTPGTVWKTLQGEQDHPATVPFTQLATMTQQEDLPFVTAIRRAAIGRSPT